MKILEPILAIIGAITVLFILLGCVAIILTGKDDKAPLRYRHGHPDEYRK